MKNTIAKSRMSKKSFIPPGNSNSGPPRKIYYKVRGVQLTPRCPKRRRFGPAKQSPHCRSAKKRNCHLTTLLEDKR